MANELRRKKIEELIKRELGGIIQKEVSFREELFLTITRVTANESVQAARVFITTFPPEKEPEAISILNRRIRMIQSMLNRRLRMRPIPKIRFVVDTLEERAQRMEETISRFQFNDHEQPDN
jgi:ribosome-binding factor A